MRLKTMDTQQNIMESNISLLYTEGPAPEDHSGDYPNEWEHYVIIALLTLLSLTGTLGNSIVLYVFLHKRDRLVSTHFILVLAFVDFITCVVVIPYTIIMECLRLEIRYDLLCKIYHFLLTSNIPFSALIMVAIAIDRYLCICHPFLRTLSLPRAKFMTVCLAVLAATIGVIVALMHGVYKDIDPSLIYGDIAAAIRPDFLRNQGNISGTEYGYYSMPSSENGDVAETSFYEEDILATEPIANEAEMTYNSYKELVVKETDNGHIVFYTGECYINTIIFGEYFQFYFQKLYTAMYLLCLVIVMVLYTLIYISVLQRRTKRERQKSQVLYLVRNGRNGDAPVGSEDTLVTTIQGGGENNKPATETSLTVKIPNANGNCVEGNLLLQDHVARRGSDVRRTSRRRKSTSKRDRLHVANLRTAGMLFVVTLVFIVTFLPALLMTNRVIPYNMIVFYMYFANNVANPVIYSFMNKNFRDNLTKLFCK